MHLRGATAFVTGAAQGLGKAFSEALLQRGALVCLSDIQADKGKKVENEFQGKYGKDKAIFIQCDVRSVENLSNVFEEAVSRFGHIDLMVNNAGIGDESRLKDMVDINLVSVIKGTDLAIGHMRKDQGGKGGTIINIASTAGLTPVYFTPNYVATKYGVVGFTSSWATNPHINEFGVQFACLCPAFTKTAIIEFKDGAVLHRDEGVSIMDKIGINEVEDVTKGFMVLVESENCNGDVVTVTKKKGLQYKWKNGRPVKPSL